ncbi:Phosphatidate cytidylyltransferase, partial [Globisporangium splendens]
MRYGRKQKNRPNKIQEHSSTVQYGTVPEPACLFDPYAHMDDANENSQAQYRKRMETTNDNNGCCSPIKMLLHPDGLRGLRQAVAHMCHAHVNDGVRKGYLAISGQQASKPAKLDTEDKCESDSRNAAHRSHASVKRTYLYSTERRQSPIDGIIGWSWLFVLQPHGARRGHHRRFFFLWTCAPAPAAPDAPDQRRAAAARGAGDAAHAARPVVAALVQQQRLLPVRHAHDDARVASREHPRAPPVPETLIVGGRTKTEVDTDAAPVLSAQRRAALSERCRARAARHVLPLALTRVRHCHVLRVRHQYLLVRVCVDRTPHPHACRLEGSVTAAPQHDSNSTGLRSTRSSSSSSSDSGRHGRSRSDHSTRSESSTMDEADNSHTNMNNHRGSSHLDDDHDMRSQRISSSFVFDTPQDGVRNLLHQTSMSSPIVVPEVTATPRHSFESNGEMCFDAVDTAFCAVSGIANRFFKGNEWLAAMLLSLATTVVMSTAFLLFAPWIPELETTELYRLRWFYALATDYVASLSAFFTPNWKYAVICLVEKSVFTLLTLHSTICPINQFGCGLSMEPAQVFLSGVVLILLFRLSTRSTSGLGVFLHIVLDMLGFLYIVGSLSVIVAFVDDDQLESYRKLLIVLLYVVWASDTGAYLTGKLLARLNYKYYNPLAAHLSKNKDYEGTLGAIGFGIAAMHIACELLNVSGSTVAKVTFTILAVVAGRIGDLFESLLKRAAGVKDSGKLIPGHGGVLDRIDALMFASLVFARYYAMIVVPGMQEGE